MKEKLGESKAELDIYFNSGTLPLVRENDVVSLKGYDIPAEFISYKLANIPNREIGPSLFVAREVLKELKNSTLTEFQKHVEACNHYIKSEIADEEMPTCVALDIGFAKGTLYLKEGLELKRDIQEWFILHEDCTSKYMDFLHYFARNPHTLQDLIEIMDSENLAELDDSFSQNPNLAGDMKLAILNYGKKGNQMKVLKNWNGPMDHSTAWSLFESLEANCHDVRRIVAKLDISIETRDMLQKEGDDSVRKILEANAFLKITKLMEVKEHDFH